MPLFVIVKLSSDFYGSVGGRMRVHDIPELTHLNIPEKILLIEDLWDSIASEESAMPIPLKHKLELDRRWGKYSAAHGELLSLEELQSRIDSRK
jgi:putative addiction module component (TIGR02574 family)